MLSETFFKGRPLLSGGDPSWSMEFLSQIFRVVEEDGKMMNTVPIDIKFGNARGW